MKYEDLTEDQRQHFDILVQKFGEYPEGTTHFDATDKSECSWIKFDTDGSFYTTPDGSWSVFDPFLADGIFIELPEKPWTTEEDK